MRDRRDLSSRQKASLARNSDISVDPYDRRAHDLAHAASHDRHLRFVAANIRAAWRNFNYLMDGARTSAHRVLKRKFMGGFSPLKFCGQNFKAKFDTGILYQKITGGISAWNFTASKQRVNFKFNRLLARREIPKQRAIVTQNLSFSDAT